jgi:hypothetical protein
MKNKLVTIDPEIVSGEPVFTGTRVPVRNLIEYLSSGHTLDDFLDRFPGGETPPGDRLPETIQERPLEQVRGRRKAA